MNAPHDEHDGQYDDAEAEQRFVAAVKAALNAPPKPQKSMTRKGVAAQSKKRRPSSKDV
jgi:hypothetical protein